MGRPRAFPKESSVFNRNASIPIARWTSWFAVVAVLTALFLLAFTGCSSGGPVKESVDKYSWAELSQIATEIHDAASDEEGLEIAIENHLLDSSGKCDGKTISVTLSNGVVAHVALVGVRADDLADGGKAGLTFMFVDAPAIAAMSEDASNDGGWEKSAMRSWLNSDFADMLPSDLRRTALHSRRLARSPRHQTSSGCPRTLRWPEALRRMTSSAVRVFPPKPITWKASSTSCFPRKA